MVSLYFFTLPSYFFFMFCKQSYTEFEVRKASFNQNQITAFLVKEKSAYDNDESEAILRERKVKPGTDKTARPMEPLRPTPKPQVQRTQVPSDGNSRLFSAGYPVNPKTVQTARYPVKPQALFTARYPVKPLAMEGSPNVALQAPQQLVAKPAAPQQITARSTGVKSFLAKPALAQQNPAKLAPMQSAVVKQPSLPPAVTKQAPVPSAVARRTPQSSAINRQAQQPSAVAKQAQPQPSVAQPAPGLKPMPQQQVLRPITDHPPVNQAQRQPIARQLPKQSVTKQAVKQPAIKIEKEVLSDFIAF